MVLMILSSYIFFFILEGLLTTVALPCYYNNKFIGVVGTDISMKGIQSQITYFQKGQASYAFMVSNFGRAMIHPLLPVPSGAFEDPISLHIAALEPEPEFGDVIASIERFVWTLHLKFMLKVLYNYDIVTGDNIDPQQIIGCIF